MRQRTTVTHEFVDYVPENLAEGTVYVCVQFATVVHTCCCGCGNEVVTPLSPADWTLSFDGESISLNPSIGNWSYPCQSHYWIRNNKVIWTRRWSRGEIEAGRARDHDARAAHLARDTVAGKTQDVSGPTVSDLLGPVRGIWARIRRWLA